MPTVLNAAPFAGLALRCQPDARLVRLCREGQDRAFEEIVRRYREPLVSFAGAIVPNHRAEDVVQEALAKAHSSLTADGAEVKLRPWLYAIVRNRALNDLRDEPRHRRLAEDLDGVPQPPDVAAERAELADLLTRVKGLPHAQREALLKRELEGRSHAEIASMLGATPGAVRGLIFRARTALRNGAGVMVPMPVLRTLLDAGRMQAETAVGIGGAAAGLTAGGGGGVAIKAGATLLVAGLAVGSGVALQDHGHNHQATAATVARDGHSAQRRAGAGAGGHSEHGASAPESGSGRGSEDASHSSGSRPGPSGGDSSGGHDRGEAGRGDPGPGGNDGSERHDGASEGSDGGSHHEGGDTSEREDSEETGGGGRSGTGGGGGSGSDDDGGDGSGVEISGDEGSQELGDQALSVAHAPARD